MSNPTPPVAALMLCHSRGDACVSEAAGHAVSAIRQRVTAATPSKWRDGIVVRTPESDGANGNWIGIDLLDATDTTWVWNHGDLGAVSIGEPVALHDLYDTLAIGATRLSILRAPR